MFVLKIFIEIAIILLIGFGLWHEDELIELEDVLIWYVKKQFKK